MESEKFMADNALADLSTLDNKNANFSSGQPGIGRSVLHEGIDQVVKEDLYQLAWYVVHFRFNSQCSFTILLFLHVRLMQHYSFLAVT